MSDYAMGLEGQILSAWEGWDFITDTIICFYDVSFKDRFKQFIPEGFKDQDAIVYLDLEKGFIQAAWEDEDGTSKLAITVPLIANFDGIKVDRS